MILLDYAELPNTFCNCRKNSDVFVSSFYSINIPKTHLYLLTKNVRFCLCTLAFITIYAFVNCFVTFRTFEHLSFKEVIHFIIKG